MVGLYGVGGLGKTTMCKAMCDFYNSKYLGKSCHIEFPSDGDDKKIVQECRKALKKLANLSDEYILSKADNFDQVIQLMRENLGRYDVFLAIDNVWERSLEAAKRMLGVNFSTNSKILLTSRSDQVLKDLVRAHSNTTVAPLPSPDRDEALHIFQDTFELAPLECLVDTDLLDSVLERCFFSGKYHPLALKVLGRYVKRVCRLDGRLNKIEDILSHILQEIVLQNDVEDLLRLNYVNLAAEKQHMFLDIVVVVMKECYGEFTYEEAHRWLSILYKEYSKCTITHLIYELALDGLILLETIIKDGHAVKMIIRVHDLYSEFAQREAARSARFFQDTLPESVEEIKWERLERVILSRSPCFIEQLQQHQCPKLQVLCADNIDLWGGIRLDLMPSLCVLKLTCGDLRRSIKNWSAAPGLAIVHLTLLNCAPPLEPIASIPCLEELIIANVQTQGPPNLAEFQHLKVLVLGEPSAPILKLVDEASDFDSLMKKKSITRVLNVSALVNLQVLRIARWKSVERIEGLGAALKNLEWLHVEECPCLRNVDGLSGLLQLEGIYIKNADLKEMPDLSGLTCLERLELLDIKSMEEVVGGLSPALQIVEVSGCEALKKMPDLRGLTCLERLVLHHNTSMEEVVGGLSPALKNVDVHDCATLKRLRRFPRLKESAADHLQTLKASGRFITNIKLPCNLQELCVSDGEWTRIECVISGVTGLQRLTIKECDSLLKLDGEYCLQR